MCLPSPTLADLLIFPPAAPLSPDPHPLFKLSTLNFRLSTSFIHPLYFLYVTHSFHRDGVCTPPSCPRRSEVQTCGRFNVLPSYPLCFQILAHSFAHRKKLSHLFSWDSALFAQNTRGGGEDMMGWLPKNEMTWTGDLPNPLSSLTAVNCPLLTTRQKAEPSCLAVPRPSHRP